MKLLTLNPKPKNLIGAGILPSVSLGEREMRCVNLSSIRPPVWASQGHLTELPVISAIRGTETPYIILSSYFTCYSVKEKAITSDARGKVCCVQQCQWETIHQLPVWAVLKQCLNDHESCAAACWPWNRASPRSDATTDGRANHGVNSGGGGHCEKRGGNRNQEVGPAQAKACPGSLASTGRAQGRPQGRPMHLEPRDTALCTWGWRERPGAARAFEA